MYTIKLVLKNGVKEVERAKTYKKAYEILEALKKKYGDRIVEIGMCGSDQEEG